MALIEPPKMSGKKQVRLRIDETLLGEIESYSEWVGGVELDEFLGQAAAYVLSRDRDWLRHKRETGQETK